MTYGWSLEMVTVLESNGGCREWFMDSAVDLSHTDEDLDDLVIGEHITRILADHTSTLTRRELGKCSVQSQVPYTHPSDPVRIEGQAQSSTAAHPLLLRTRPH